MCLIDPPHLRLDWDRLLDDICNGDVVPVLGSDAVLVDHDGGPVDLQLKLAGLLARNFREGTFPDGPPPSMSSVAARYLKAAGGKRDALKSVVRSALDEVNQSEVPEALKKLAAIEPFRLFVTTTPDQLLARALVEVRGEEPAPETFAFALQGQGRDLPDHLFSSAQPDQAFVYHLLGDSGRHGYAITDEDLLEYAYQLQGTKGPKNLLNLLGSKQLLFIGCRFPDWLTRILLRITTGGSRLSDDHQQRIIAGGTTAPASRALPTKTRYLDGRKDKRLAAFLTDLTEGTQVVDDMSAVDFIEELHEKWVAGGYAERSRDPGSNEPPEAENKIFLSYASEDKPTLREIVAALDERKLPVWFDERELAPGDRWQQMIRRGIGSAALFVPVISQHVLTHTDRQFIYEWRRAAKRVETLPEIRRFVVPLRLDETPYDSPEIDEMIREIDWAEWSDWDDLDGRTAFLDRIEELFHEVQKKRAGASG